MSKWNSRVFPGSSFDALAHTRRISILERSPCWHEGKTRLAERETTSFKIFRASLQWTLCGQVNAQWSRALPWFQNSRDSNQRNVSGPAGIHRFVTVQEVP